MNCLSDVERKVSAMHGWDRELAELRVPELGSRIMCWKLQEEPSWLVAAAESVAA